MDLIALAIFFCGFIAAGAIEEWAAERITLFSTVCWASAVCCFILTLLRLP